ncbi:MAG: molybdopterin molybdotransferase MoeA [Flavobacteriales bacterium]|nr:molybdopterin molybdotransferase MoeA [Flavobacteriales bacterium]
MISASEAQHIILSNLFSSKEERINFSHSLGRVLVEEIRADNDLPSFDRVTMDGIAIRSVDFNNGFREFSSIGIQSAGVAALEIEEAGTCLEVTTGSICPIGADCILPYEIIKQESVKWRTETQNIKPWQNIHRKGSDVLENDLLLEVGTAIGPAEIGVLASIGKKEVSVSSLPGVIIFSTGNELVEVHQTPKPYQIRRSNVYALKAMLTKIGITAEDEHIDDDIEVIKHRISGALKSADVLLLSGGVSKGKFDFIPDVLKELQVEMLFHTVAQKPGKPFWFGRTEKCFVFAFPGNPVSTFACAAKYLLPWLQKSLKQEVYPTTTAKLTTDFEKKSGLTHFLQVKLHFSESGEHLATAVPGNGSGDFVSLVKADAFMELPEEATLCRAGEVYPLILWR